MINSVNISGCITLLNAAREVMMNEILKVGAEVPKGGKAGRGHPEDNEGG